MQVIEHIALLRVKLRAVEGQPFKFRMIDELPRHRLVEVVRRKPVGRAHRIHQRQIRIAVHVHIAENRLPLPLVDIFSREVDGLDFIAVHRHADVKRGLAVFAAADDLGRDNERMAVLAEIKRFLFGHRRRQQAKEQGGRAQRADRLLHHRLLVS